VRLVLEQNPAVFNGLVATFGDLVESFMGQDSGLGRIFASLGRGGAVLCYGVERGTCVHVSANCDTLVDAWQRRWNVTGSIALGLQ
jgi:hypothetical protein